MFTKKPTNFQEYVGQKNAFTPLKLLVELTANKSDPELSTFAEQYSNMFIVAFRNWIQQTMKEPSVSKNLLTILPTTVMVAQEIGPISEGLQYFYAQAISGAADARDYACHFGLLEGVVHGIQQLIVTATTMAAETLQETQTPTAPTPVSPTKEKPAPSACHNSDRPIEIQTAHYAHTMGE
jgi:hypothetical protein